MRKLIFFMHTSLDGFVAGPHGEIDWIKLDDEMFDFVGTMTDQPDSTLYGRVTYEQIQNYWPTAGEQKNATKHDIQHSIWYNQVDKVVLSRTISQAGLKKTTVVSDRLSEHINHLKQKEGKNIIIFGSPGASHALLDLNLIDEFWLFVNPVILGQGKPLFKEMEKSKKLVLEETKLFPCGVIALHYSTAVPLS